MAATSAFVARCFSRGAISLRRSLHDEPGSAGWSRYDMIDLVRELCGFRSAAVADENEALFSRIDRELPLEIFRFQSGDSHQGWVVPDNWRVRRAKVFRDGAEVFDGTNHALGVGYYSRSFSGPLAWEELEPRLVTNRDLPGAYMFHCMWQ